MQNQPSPTIFYSENILYLLIQNYFSKIYIGMICSTMYLCIEKFSYSKRSMIQYKGFFLNFLAHAKQSLFSITTQLLLIQYHTILTIILGKIYYFWRQAYLICLKSETGSFLKLFLPTHKILHIRNPSQSAQESFRNFSQHLSQCYFYFQKLCTTQSLYISISCRTHATTSLKEISTISCSSGSGLVGHNPSSIFRQQHYTLATIEQLDSLQCVWSFLSVQHTNTTIYQQIAETAERRRLRSGVVGLCAMWLLPVCLYLEFNN